MRRCPSHQPGLQPLGVMPELQMMVHIQGYRAWSMGHPHLLPFLGFLRPAMHRAPFPGLRKYPSALLQFSWTKAGPWLCWLCPCKVLQKSCFTCSPGAFWRNALETVPLQQAGPVCISLTQQNVTTWLYLSPQLENHCNLPCDLPGQCHN